MRPILVCFGCFLLGCTHSDHTDNSTDQGVGVGEADTDTDSDTDTDTDTDADTDADTDTDTDTDADTDTDTDTNANIDTNSTAQPNTDTDTGNNSDTGSSSNTDSNSEPNRDSHTDSASSSASGTDPAPSSNALEELGSWLHTPSGSRTPIENELFATVPLTQDDAKTAQKILWEDLAAQIKAQRQSEVDAKTIEYDGFVLRYDTVPLGDNPQGGRSLFISMHGGGSAPAATNDQQWQNQIALAQSYNPKDTLWIAPRAPTDDWNMWFKDHIDPMFDRLITNMIVFENINPNKVYLTGYSAGGDGVYQLGPRMADRWAAAAMSAGHPNASSPVNLRNIGFAIHVGGDDTAFNRNKVALEWGGKLDDLQTADPRGYPHQVQVHDGLPHWMELADQVSIPYIQGFVRNPAPKRVVWHQQDVAHSRLYWIFVPPDQKKKDSKITGSYEGQTLSIETADVTTLNLRITDQMLNMDEDVTVNLNGAQAYKGPVFRTILVIHNTMAEREDPAMVYWGEVVLQI